MTLQQLLYIVRSPVYYILNLPLDLLRVTGRLRRVSPATVIAVLLFLFLATLEVTAFLCATLRPDAAEWWTWFTPQGGLGYTVALIALPIVIPIVVRLAILYWMEPDASPFPDIEQAWKSGITALGEHNIQINQTPLFLIIGLNDEQAAEMLMMAAGREWLVKGVPSPSPPIQFYATGDAVFICCIDCSQSSRLAGTDAVNTAPTPGKFAEQTMSPEFNAGRGTAVTFDGGARGSMADVSMPSSGRSILEDSSVISRGARGYTGTLDGFGGGGGASLDMSMVRMTPSAGAGIAQLHDNVAENQTRRLAYLCKTIRQARDPFCPINGVLSILPYKLIQTSDLQASELAKAVQTDTETMRKHLHLRCSVLGLINGLESEPGFCELKRRLGKTAARENRFGKGFRRLWVQPTAEPIEALTAHACQQFESWTYHLFRQENALQKIGNAKLYALLCKVRTQLRQRMIDTISRAFAFDPQRDRAADKDRMLFGGLYFGSSGERQDMHGFVKGVFDKLVQREDVVEWTPEMLASDRRFQYWAQISTLVFWIMLLANAGMIYFLFFHNKT